LIDDIITLIRNKLEQIKPYLTKNNITAFRLLNNTSSLFPVSIEIFQKNAVIHVFNQIALPAFPQLEKSLKEVLQIEDIFYKKNSTEDFYLPASKPKKIIIEEYGHKFLINLSDYLDTGLFLDHRETRRWIGSRSKNKVVLNTFAYTGSFTVYAARSGATRTYSVDISKVYCEWIKENLTLNNLTLDNQWVARMDTLEFFQYARKKNLIFDVIIIDPPTFSKNKGKSFSVQKDHPSLINHALELLSPRGFILFSNNYQLFRMNYRELNPCLVKENLDLIPPDCFGTRLHRCFIISNKQ
jgi:23S rRNA (cytosine1962-C5)-methyltransferase